MKRFIGEHEFSFKPEQMFDLVADVESYEEYLPGWRNAKILRRDGNIAYVEQDVGFGKFCSHFISKAIYKRPERIDILSSNGLFKQLNVQWVFQPSDYGGCIVRFNIEIDLRSRYLERIAKRYFIELMEQIIEAVEKRAEQFYSPAIIPALLHQELQDVKP